MARQRFPYDPYLETQLREGGKAELDRRRPRVVYVREVTGRPKNWQPGTPLPGTDFYLTDAWRELRYQTLKKHGRRCACCGATAENGVRMHVDHIKPRSLFPSLALDSTNLPVLCEDCNVGKKNSDSIAWNSRNSA